MNNSELKLLFSAAPKKLKLSELSDNDIHRLCISVNNVSFETFFLPSPYRKLYVSLSTVGIDGRPYPIFHRAAWHNSFDGMFLCIDDPTRYETGLAPTYYFGNKDTNYLALVCEIINKFLEVYKITYKNLTIISSSNGGFGALWCTRRLPGSTCLAFCPQFDVPLYLASRRKRFETAFDISFSDSTIADRISLYDILDETESKICIYSNIKSDIDKVQIDSFFQKNGLTYSVGLQKFNNIWFIIAEIDAIDGHLAQPLSYISRIIEQLMGDEWGGWKFPIKK